MSKQLKPSLRAILAGQTPAAPDRASALTPPPEPVSAPAVLQPPPSKATLKERAKQLSVYLEEPVYDQLRELAHVERRKLHSLVLEGLDLLFRARGVPAIEQVMGNHGAREE